MNCQQDELYAAELGGLRGDRLETREEIEAYVNALRDTPWWQERFAQVVYVEARVRKSNTAGSCGAFIKEHNAGLIEMAPCHCCEQYVLHELAHVLAHARYGCCSHGPWFARTYLELVYLAMGTEAYSLLYQAFESAGIDNRIDG